MIETTSAATNTDSAPIASRTYDLRRERGRPAPSSLRIARASRDHVVASDSGSTFVPPVTGMKFVSPLHRGTR